MSGPREGYTRVCDRCGASYKRKRYPSGERESKTAFARRRYCSADCQRKAAAPNGGKARHRHYATGWDARVLPPDGANVGRGEFWKPGDRLWHPSGSTGPALTAKLHRRIEEQVRWVCEQPELVRQIQNGADPGELLERIFRQSNRKTQLLYGTVRRVAEVAALACEAI